jgi:uroporphyrinogen decarboxylase
MDPCMLYADYETIKIEAEKMLKAFGPNRHIANLGHGLYPDLDKDKVKFFIDCVKSYRHS